MPNRLAVDKWLHKVATLQDCTIRRSSCSPTRRRLRRIRPNHNQRNHNRRRKRCRRNRKLPRVARHTLHRSVARRLGHPELGRQILMNGLVDPSQRSNRQARLEHHQSGRCDQRVGRMMQLIRLQSAVELVATRRGQPVRVDLQTLCRSIVERLHL